MLEKLKKCGLCFYISLIALVLIFVSMILAISSSTNLGYSIDELPLIVTFSIISIICIIGSALLSFKFKNNALSYAPLLVAMVLSGICFTFVISSRTYLMGTLWFTKIDESNQYAVAARNTGVPSFIMYFISMVVLSVASFFNLAKNDKVVENSN